MRKGIYREQKSSDGTDLWRAFVVPNGEEAGEWLDKFTYVALGYPPAFDTLPVVKRVVQQLGSVTLSNAELEAIMNPGASDA